MHPWYSLLQKKSWKCGKGGGGGGGGGPQSGKEKPFKRLESGEQVKTWLIANQKYTNKGMNEWMNE